MGVVQDVRRTLARFGLLRDSNSALSFSQWLSYFSFNGTGYSLMPTQTISSKQEVPSPGFESYIQSIYKTNGIVFACMLARQLLFSEARFQFRRFEKGRPGELFGTSALRPLEQPFQNATTGDLLARAIQDADIGGTHFACRRREQIFRMRPDWTTIVVGSRSTADDPEWTVDAQILGYIYQRGGSAGSGRNAPEVLLPNEVAHWSPIPDPSFRFRGMSWLTPVINEVMGDNAATTHKLKFFENGATPNMIVSLDKSVGKDQYDAFVTKMEEQHEGVLNAYKTLYLGGGSTAMVVGANMRQVDFKVTQGAGETRIAAAARIPPIIVGLSEGLAAATYSNYGQARRAFADGTMRPLWRGIAGAYAHLVDVPSGAELWYDDRDISFLQEDMKDAADIQQVQASAMKSLIDAGYTPDTVKEAIISGDFNRLKHSGLFSVQLQDPTKKTADTAPSTTTPPPTGTDTPPAIAATTPPTATPPPTTKRDVDELEPATNDGALSDRERAVAKLIGGGLTNKEVARRLELSERSIERAVSSAMAKMGVRSRTELAVVIDVTGDLLPGSMPTS